MRCSSRSTTCRGSLWLVALFSLLLRAPVGAREDGGAVLQASAVRHAVVEAVKARMGQTAEVRVEDLRIAALPVAGDLTLVAVPEPGARLARQNRFTLQWVATTRAAGHSPVAGGYALASVFVSVEHARASKVIARGETCDEFDLIASRGEVGAVLLQRLPRLSDVKGTTALRDVQADEVLTRAAVAVRQTVRSGDVVVVRATSDGVTVQGEGVAQQSGGEGDVIRVVNRESRRPLKARVVGPGKVEVVQ